MESLTARSRPRRKRRRTKLQVMPQLATRRILNLKSLRAPSGSMTKLLAKLKQGLSTVPLRMDCTRLRSSKPHPLQRICPKTLDFSLVSAEFYAHASMIVLAFMTVQYPPLVDRTRPHNIHRCLIFAISIAVWYTTRQGIVQSFSYSITTCAS